MVHFRPLVEKDVVAIEQAAAETGLPLNRTKM